MANVTDSKLRTGWVCIATEGATVDGRTISRQWLDEMAASYDPDFYTASLWPDHQRYYAMGHVAELKAEEEDGKLKLYAVLCPTRDLVYYNQVGQYQFCSIEPVEKFADTGKTYLFGLGVTDTPASTGTTRMQFRAKQEPQAICASEPLKLDNLQAEQQQAETGLFAALKKFLATHGEQQEPAASAEHDHTEDQAMDQKQFEALTAKMDALEQKFDAAMNTKVEGDKATDKTAEQKADEQGTAHFAALTEKLDGIATKQAELEQKFSALMQEKPGQELPGAPAGNKVQLV